MSQTKAELIKGLNINASAPATALQIDASGNVNIDSNTLYVDATNNRVGIGTTNPGAYSGQLVVNISPSGDHLVFSDDSTSSGAAAARLGCSGNNLVFKTNSGASAATERARIDSSGRLLVGTSSTSATSTAVFASRSDAAAAPLVAFHTTESTVTTGANFGTLSFGNTASSGTNAGAFIQAQRDGGTWTNNSSMPGRLTFSTTADGASSPTERMRITSTGDIYCGNSAQPSLFLGSTTNAGSGTILSRIVGRSNVYGSNTAAINFRGGDSGYADWSVISFDTTGSSGTVERLRISSNGTFTGSASNDISDQRLKHNIQSIDNAIDKVKSLVGRTFEWKPDASMQPGVKYGFIAQEVENVIPELVEDKTGIRMLDNEGNIVKNPEDYDGPLEYAKSVQTSGIVPVLLEALKEAIAKIETLEAKVAALEGASPNP